MLLYLDTCCLNRPWDDRRQLRVQLEGDVINAIAAGVDLALVVLCGSDAIDFETARIPDYDRLTKVRAFAAKAAVFQEYGSAERDRAAALVPLGFRPLDAAHVACAEAAGADFLLTTDDRFLKTAHRYQSQLTIRVENPIVWSSFLP
ncbi:MAG TPA: hypothetical protein PLA50_05290 [Bacteroidia bacterium]|nr:hypothetical protein [Bacteroidia bacterium]